MSFVASCHHRVAQCFRMHGNAKHGLDDKVSLEEFQAAIRARHGAVVSGEGISRPRRLRPWTSRAERPYRTFVGCRSELADAGSGIPELSLVKSQISSQGMVASQQQCSVFCSRGALGGEGAARKRKQK